MAMSRLPQATRPRRTIEADEVGGMSIEDRVAQIETCYNLLVEDHVRVRHRLDVLEQMHKQQFSYFVEGSHHVH